MRHSDGSGVVMNTLRDCPIAESLLLRFAKDVFKITPPQDGKPIIPPLTYGKKLDLLDARKSLGLESETVPQTPVQIPQEGK